jgi:purine nucleosidase/pyrimidine-specific ribonucleoside hydrolase
MKTSLPTALLLAASVCHAQQRIPIIFDTDIGDDIDDALALALAVQSPELDVRAVTTVIDNTEQRTRLAWKQLGIYNRRDIPLATGAVEPFLDPVQKEASRQFEVLTPEDTIPAAARRRAADLIIETVMASPRKVTLVPVGPLTNIALALKTEPRIKTNIERIVIMGGAFEMLVAEYNIRRDRVAAEIVFRSGIPITAVGLDVTTKCKLKAEDIDRLRAANNPASAFVVRLIELWQNGKPGAYPTLHDPLAVAVSFLPALVETRLGSVSVETNSPLSNGITLFTRADKLPAGENPTTQVALKVDSQRFVNLFLERLAAPPRGK